MVVLHDKMRFGRRVRLIVAHRESTGSTPGDCGCIATLAEEELLTGSGSLAACSPKMMPLLLGCA